MDVQGVFRSKTSPPGGALPVGAAAGWGGVVAPAVTFPGIPGALVPYGAVGLHRS